MVKYFSRGDYIWFTIVLLFLLYNLFFIAAVAWRFRATFVILFILITLDLEHYPKFVIS